MGMIEAIQKAELSATIINGGLQRYVDLINDNIRPPVAVSPDDVLIRAMYVINDAINSYGGKFDRVDLPQIAALFIDSPVLIGHDKSGLPVARNFWAEVIEKDDKLWIKSYFYWLKQGDSSNRLKLNIDSGIYKECSVSFTYNLPECSACGQDIRYCGHQVSKDVHFTYRGVDRILETSLVYRGSIPNTHLTDRLFVGKNPGIKNQPDSQNAGLYTLMPYAYVAADPIGREPASGFKTRLGGVDFFIGRR